MYQSLINDKWAIQRAKFTIEKYYSVVGVLEQWNETLTALEKFVPKFFRSSARLYYDEGGNVDGTVKKFCDYPHSTILSCQVQQNSTSGSAESQFLHLQAQLLKWHLQSDQSWSRSCTENSNCTNLSFNA